MIKKRTWYPHLNELSGIISYPDRISHITWENFIIIVECVSRQQCFYQVSVDLEALSYFYYASIVTIPATIKHGLRALDICRYDPILPFMSNEKRNKKKIWSRDQWPINFYCR